MPSRTPKRRLARSKAATGGYLGPMPEDLWEVVDSAWRQPFALQSNYARERSIPIALAASLGWISNIAPDGLNYLRTWHCTREGLTALEHRVLYSPRNHEDPPPDRR